MCIKVLIELSEKKGGKNFRTLHRANRTTISSSIFFASSVSSSGGLLVRISAVDVDWRAQWASTYTKNIPKN
jgi:hypothetical protein